MRSQATKDPLAAVSTNTRRRPDRRQGARQHRSVAGANPIVTLRVEASLPRRIPRSLLSVGTRTLALKAEV